MGDTASEVYFGFPAELLTNATNVGEGAIGFAGALGNVFHIAAKMPDQFVNVIVIIAADIENLPADVRCRRNGESLGHVGNVSEIPALFSIADHSIGFAGQFLCEEYAKNGAIGPGGSGADIFWQGVGILGADFSTLRRGIIIGNAVTGGRGGINQPFNICRPAALQYVERTLHIGGIVDVGVLNGGDDIGLASQVKYLVHTFKAGANGFDVGNVGLDHL